MAWGVSWPDRLTAFRRFALALTVVGVMLIMAGCDGENAEEVRAVSESYLIAAASGDPAICDLLSEAELNRIALASEDAGTDPLTTCRASVERPLNADAIRRAADSLPQSTVGISGDTATIEIDASNGAGAPMTIDLVRQDGLWKVDGTD
jgi:hypothetical protein